MAYNPASYLSGRSVTLAGRSFTIVAVGTTQVGDSEERTTVTLQDAQGGQITGDANLAPLADPTQQRPVVSAYGSWGSAEPGGPARFGSFNLSLTWNPSSVMLSPEMGGGVVTETQLGAAAGQDRATATRTLATVAQTNAETSRQVQESAPPPQRAPVDLSPHTLMAATSSARRGQLLSWPTEYPQWSGFLQEWGLDANVAVLALALGHYAMQLLGRGLVITSGLRTREEQAALLQAYLDGAPGIFKPASDSPHLRGLAFDAVMSDGSYPDATIGQLAGLLGLRWGGSFSTPDPVHFDAMRSGGS